MKVNVDKEKEENWSWNFSDWKEDISNKCSFKKFTQKTI